MDTAARREQLKDALVAAAARTIAKEGVGGLKARALADEVGCAVGAIYNVVADLDELTLLANSQTLAALEQVLTAAAVPGHGPPSVAWPAAVQPQKQYLQRISADVRRMIKQGRSIAEAAASVGLSERDAWVLFDEFNARNVTAAFAELEWE